MTEVDVLDIARTNVEPLFDDCVYNAKYGGRPDSSKTYPLGTDSNGSTTLTRKRINCVQFTYAVLWEIMQLPDFLTYTDDEGNCVDLPVSKQKDYLYVKGKIPGNKKDSLGNMHDAILSRDLSVSGPVGAIVEYGMGHEVGVSELIPGDFVQFWRWDKKAKRWGPSGHSVLISGHPEKIADGYRCETWGAQGSGIGFATFDFDSTKKVFAARITGSTGEA